MSYDPLATEKSKIVEIEMLATWASIIGYGDVRDKLRIAKAALQEHINFRGELFRRAEEGSGAGRAVDATRRPLT